MVPKQHRGKAAGIALAVGLVGGFEGLRQTVYLDVVKVPTYCYGETKSPNWSKRYTLEECNTLLEGRLAEFAEGVDKCVAVDMPPKRWAASISLAYNIGIGAFCKSTFVRRLNAGEGAAACDSMLAFNKAKGKVFPGLERRRQAEAALCRQEG